MDIGLVMPLKSMNGKKNSINWKMSGRLYLDFLKNGDDFTCLIFRIFYHIIPIYMFLPKIFK